METFLTFTGYAPAGFAAIFIIRRQILNFIDIRIRNRLKEEILSLADDLTTMPGGMSFNDVVELLEVKMIVEIVDELRKMSPGSRSLQQAIDITGHESYGQAA